MSDSSARVRPRPVVTGARAEYARRSRRLRLHPPLDIDTPGVPPPQRPPDSPFVAMVAECARQRQAFWEALFATRS